MIVIDIGCARYGDDFSIERLVEEFHPTVLYGFDPNPQTQIDVVEIGNTRVHVERRAAWIYDGEIGYREDGLGSWLTADERAPKVPCFDLARWLARRWLARLRDDEIVLKLDCEGSEYALLERLIETRTDALLSLALVEWHEPDKGRARIEERLACELEEWRW